MTPSTRPQRGFTLIELSIVLVVLGLLAAASLGAFANRDGRRIEASAEAARIEAAVVAFARLQHRLPCPDTSADGREGNAGVCPTGTETGWVPYESLGLANPPAAQRARYLVYRNGAAGADLAVLAERTADLPGTTGHLSRNDLLSALAGAAAQPVAAGHLHLTGDGGIEGAEDCATNRRHHPAFALILPGEDRSGNGSGFDGLHAALPAAGACIASPGRAASPDYDDHVLAHGLTTLAGHLLAGGP